MNNTRRVTLSAALVALICFFLPWLEVSCLGVKDSVSGLDLARQGHRGLTLVPLLMLVVLLIGLARVVWERQPAVFALVSIVGGSFSTYLMYRERVDARPTSGLLAAQMTVWYWLGLVSSLVVAVAALSFYVKCPRGPTA